MEVMVWSGWNTDHQTANPYWIYVIFSEGTDAFRSRDELVGTGGASVTLEEVFS